MKAEKAILKNTLFKDKRGTEFLVLGKWEGVTSKSGVMYLLWNRITNTFSELDSGHVKVDKSKVKLNLPRFAYGSLHSKKIKHKDLDVLFEAELVEKENETKQTIAKWNDIGVVVVGLIQDEKYPSGAAYILYRPGNLYQTKTFIVDSLEVEILRQGNMIII